ncbi:WD40 repeat-like protein [Linderina pennispora]|uniref:WD40 repeat-like protein n=1 Tax=Linderina pennispora TaxID=61395 RepID=A0A1Y1W1P8_9FUNG|nr:WD40 repeat-like protein [Linderina pennispora]ORX67044.1 WD40 repeat-like protein [Linderina pennispora]
MFTGHYGGITAIDYDSDQGLVASGSLDTQVRVWDSGSGECKYTISGHSDIIRDVQFYDRFLITGANDGRMRMWDLSLFDSVQPRPSTKIMREEYVAPSRDGSGLCCENTFVGHKDAVTCFQASYGKLISGGADKTVREWDLSTGQLRQTIDVNWATKDSHSTRVAGRNLASAPVAKRGTDEGDGGFIGALQFYDFALATGTADGVLRLWDLRTAQAHRQMFGHSQPITSLQFDEQTVLTGSLDGTAQLWDLAVGPGPADINLWAASDQGAGC